MNMLVFLMTVYEYACYDKNKEGKRKADEGSRNGLKKVIGVGVVEGELHHPDKENDGIVKSVAALENEDRLTHNMRVVVHEGSEFLCGDYKPRDYKGDRYEPV